jgi:hypothetical protein
MLIFVEPFWIMGVIFVAMVPFAFLRGTPTMPVTMFRPDHMHNVMMLSFLGRAS